MAGPWSAKYDEYTRFFKGSEAEHRTVAQQRYASVTAGARARERAAIGALAVLVG
jgi:hypothetical protein